MILVVYYSRAGGNYKNGEIVNLPIGNTEVVANIIKDLCGADIFKVEQIIEYSNDYNECARQAKRDLEQNNRPKLKKYLNDLDNYTDLIVCYPNYWGTMPMAMFEFLEHYDLKGKNIYPICTHEGSSMGGSIADIRRCFPSATIKTGLPILGSLVDSSESKIESYLTNAKLIK